MAEIIVEYRWSRARPILSIIAWHGLLAVFAVWVWGVYTGKIVSSSPIATLFVVGGGATLYVTVFAVFVRMLVGGPFLTVYRDGRLHYRETFKRHNYILERGSRIAVDHRRVIIETQLPRIGRHNSRGGSISIAIPPGVKLAEGGSLIIDDGEVL